MIDCQSRSRLLTRAASMVSLLVVAGYLVGCAGMGDGMVSGAFVDPAKYSMYDCKQLEAERAALVTRTAELQGLIDKAHTGTAGSVVGELAYRNDYISVRASAKLAETEWQRGKCVASAPGTPPVPVPAAPAPRKRAGMH